MHSVLSCSCTAAGTPCTRCALTVPQNGVVLNSSHTQLNTNDLFSPDHTTSRTFPCGRVGAITVQRGGQLRPSTVHSHGPLCSRVSPPPKAHPVPVRSAGWWEARAHRSTPHRTPRAGASSERRSLSERHLVGRAVQRDPLATVPFRDSLRGSTENKEPGTLSTEHPGGVCFGPGATFRGTGLQSCTQGGGWRKAGTLQLFT